VIALSRDILNHTPLLLGSNQPLFKFKLGWLLRYGFTNKVKQVWETMTDESDTMKHWQSKIRRLRQHLLGWAKNISGANQKEKKELLDKLDMLDKTAEAGLLMPHEVDHRLSQMLREEKIKWYQISKAKNLLEGDSNTKYFQLLANGRHQKIRIFQLQDGGDNICGDNELNNI
jgi:hypothetical protein